MTLFDSETITIAIAVGELMLEYRPEGGTVEGMRIVVCVKHVPDLQAERALSDTGFVVRGDDDVLNSLDENAVQEAVNLAGDEGEVIALTMGPEDAVDGLRRCLALGATRAIHVCDERAAGSDILGTANVLAATIKKIAEDGPIDMIVTGMAAQDGMSATIPSTLAAHLDWPALTLAHEVTMEGSTVRIERSMGKYHDTVEADLPVILSVTDQANTVKYPNFKAIMAAKKKTITTYDLDDIQVVAPVGSSGAATKVTAATERPVKEAGDVVTDSGDGGTKLAAYILEALK